MKRIFFFLAIMIAGSLVLNAQEPTEKEIRKAKKAEKKQQKIENREKHFEVTKLILNNKNFVLEAHTLSNRYGSRVPVSSTLNFIFVDSSDAVIQTGNEFGIGYNGLGGVTAEGNINNWELDVNEKKHIFHVKMNVMTQIGTYDIFMNVDARGNARATLYGVRGESITYTGQLYPANESVAYQGYTSY